MVGCTEVLLGVDHQAALDNFNWLNATVTGSGWRNWAGDGVG